MAKGNRGAKVAPSDIPVKRLGTGTKGKGKEADTYGFESDSEEDDNNNNNNVEKKENDKDKDISRMELGDSSKKKEKIEPLKDALGVEIVVDEFGKPINPVVTENDMPRFDQEVDYVMGNIENRLFSLHIDEVFQKNKVVFIMMTMGTTLIGFVLFLYGMNLSVIFEGTKQSYDYVAIAFACVFWLPVFSFISYMIYPWKKDERKRRRRLAWDRKDRRKSNLFNQLVDEARNATEPPPYKTRVIAHFRKKEYPMVVPTWEVFCRLFESKTGLPPERQLIRYEGVDFDIDLTKNLHDAPYHVKQNGHLWIYNRGGYFTQDHKVKIQYEDLMEQAKRPKAEPYEKPPDFDVEPSFVSELMATSGKYRLTKSNGTAPAGRDSQSRDSLNGSRGSMRGANSKVGESNGSQRPRTPTKPGSASVQSRVSVKQQPATTKIAVTKPPPIATNVHLPQISNIPPSSGGSVVSGGGSTIGGSIATGSGAMRGDRSLASTI